MENVCVDGWVYLYIGDIQVFGCWVYIKLFVMNIGKCGFVLFQCRMFWVKNGYVFIVIDFDQVDV